MRNTMNNVSTPFRIKNNPHGFGRWKNPLIDALARAYGCKVQVIKPESAGADNAILFGNAINASKALSMFEQIQNSAFEAVCKRMKLENVPIPDRRYSASFYGGYVKAIAEKASERISTNKEESEKVGFEFPQSNGAYPIFTKHDARIAYLGHEAGQTATIVWR